MSGIPPEKIAEFANNKFDVLGDYIFSEDTLKWIKSKINRMRRPRTLKGISQNLGYDERTTLAFLQSLQGIIRGEAPNLVLDKFPKIKRKKSK